jgi:hypothetical protein
MSLYEVVDPMPQAFVSHPAFFFSSTPAVIAALGLAKGWKDFVKIVDDPLHHTGGSPILPPGDDIESVRASWESPSKILIEAVGKGGGILGVKTVFSAGWTAVQAGEELPVVRVAGVQTGVWVKDVSKGVVTLEYKIPHFARSLALTILGLILAAALLVLGPWFHRRH